MAINRVKINRGLYIITDMNDALISNAESGEISMIQFRNKSAPAECLGEMARAFVALARQLKAVAIINDDPHLAAAVHADGVHLGVTDMPIREARKIVGDQRIIGSSCHASLLTAQRTVAAGADYVAFGSVFPSVTKPDAPRISLSNLRVYKRRLNVPVCAIGGINARNIDAVVATGADLIAILSAAADSKRLSKRVVKHQ